jgi:4-amino-4-deoxy-L-arabinose transferase-like glycosyltransferase
MLEKFKKAVNYSLDFNSINWVIVCLLFGAYFYSRLVFLDADIPIWDLSFYSPIDELYYTGLAFQKFQGVDWRLKQAVLRDWPNFIDITQQISTYFTLKLAGNNYYGLRLPSVIMGAFSVTFLYSLLKNRFGLLLAIVGSLIFISNYGFILATRIAEPTIFRMAFMLFVMYFLSVRIRWGKISLFLEVALGFLSGYSVFFIYPTNLFIIPAVFCIYFYISLIIYKEKLNRGYAFFVIGLVMSFLLYILFTLSFSYFDFKFLDVFSPRVRVPAMNFLNINVIKSTMLSILSQASYFSNYNLKLLFEMAFFFFFLGFACNTIIFFFKNHGVGSKYYKKYFILNLSNLKYLVDSIILIFFISFLAQTCFVNDYPQRKLIILFPIVIYIICFMLNVIKVLFVKYNKGLRYIALLIIIGILVPIIFSNTMESYDKVYKNPKYSYKKAMQSMKDYDGELIIAGYSFGFRMYNQYHTAINIYTYWYTEKKRYIALITSLAKKYEGVRIIDSSDSSRKSFLLKLGFQPEKIIHRSRDPRYSDMVLYGTVKSSK